jgi:hypothetical protein
MPRTLVKHGTNTGYRAELEMGGDPCIRCRNARRVFQSQYTKAGKRAGLKYHGDQVIDHLYTGSGRGQSQRVPRTPVSQPSDDYDVHAAPADTGPSRPADGPTGPSLSDRIAGLLIPSQDDASNEYVSDTEYPDYITPGSVDPDPEPPGAEYEQASEQEYLINAAGMAKIEDSLGTYLSIFGITMEMVDPYCGPILAQNMDNIVKRWAKVIAKYPKAAELFMEGKGGTLMLWIGAIQATWPFLFAIYEHHFSKDVQTSGGNIYRKGTDRFANTVDPLAGQDQFNYTAG